jgi:hypothetical protein
VSFISTQRAFLIRWTCVTVLAMRSFLEDWSAAN